MSREKKVEEVRKEFLDHVRNLVDYWVEHGPNDTKEKLDGLAFSILSAIDGCSSDLPPFALIPVCSNEDKKFYIEQGLDYYPTSPSNVKCDIAGELHECYYE